MVIHKPLCKEYPSLEIDMDKDYVGIYERPECDDVQCHCSFVYKLNASYLKVSYAFFFHILNSVSVFVLIWQAKCNISCCRMLSFSYIDFSLFIYLYKNKMKVM